jgi:adenine-specific DNA-methyltransferase
MPEIVFKGKEYVYNHHLTVPYRPLVVDKAKGNGPGDLNSSLVIHGDNLHALKALLPRYAGKVDLVFIDPPYNTGNEGWCYSDGVNSPIMKEWLSTNPVDGEDMLRHDKWLCMMWPRLVLLRELMSDSGSIWITLDDNEVHRARMMLDEIFGAENFVANVVWQKRTSPEARKKLGAANDHVLVYAKQKIELSFSKLERSLEQVNDFSNPDNDPKGPWTSTDLTAQNPDPTKRKDQQYQITLPNGEVVSPPPGRAWSTLEPEFLRLKSEGRIWFGVSGNARPRVKTYLDESEGVSSWTWWTNEEVGHNQEAKKEILEILGPKNAFDYPKPTRLIGRILDIAGKKDSIILDSFAGSGTTAHAVLKANAKDNGNRQFILVEGEDYADRLTAERVRRAIQGYAWVGTQRETLLEEKINFTQFKKAADWLAKVEAIKQREGFVEVPDDLLSQAAGAGQSAATSKRFDKINVELKDGVLRVEGEKKVSERAEGLGGEFTYCTLGDPLNIEKMLSGENLPAFEALGAWLFHTATGGTLPPAPKSAPRFYLGEAADAHVWLVYEPRLAFLKSTEAALNLSRAQAFVQWGTEKGDGKKHLVFAPAKYLSNKQLAEHRMDFAALPFALLRGV